MIVKGKPIAFRQAYLDSLNHYLASTKSLPRVDFSESTPGHNKVDSKKSTNTGKRETFIPVEKINGPVLPITGEDDQMWPADLFAQKVYLRLKKYHHIHKYEYLIYKHACHKIGYPYLPTTVNREKVYRYGGMNGEMPTPQQTHGSVYSHGWRSCSPLFQRNKRTQRTAGS